MPQHPPLALIASGNEWLARSLESVLTANSYAVLRTYTPAQTLEHARLVQPDAIFIDTGFHTQEGGIELCTALNLDPYLSPSPPIMLIVSGPVTRQNRLRALHAGAWEVLGLPLDADALLSQLETFVRARIEAERYREDGLTDSLTGLYNLRGLLRRVRELGSVARRYRRALACVVFGAGEPRRGGAGETVPRGAVFPVKDFAHLLRRECRTGDAVGHLGQNEFVVIAPDTGPEAAFSFAQRITAATDMASPREAEGGSALLRAGLFAVTDLAAAAVEPVELLVRATLALRRSRSEPTAERIATFRAPDRLVAPGGPQGRE